jgi:hypothetical protein
MAELTRTLLNMFGHGDLSANAVHKIAAAAYRDGWGRGVACAERLARHGRSDSGYKNAMRDIMVLAQEFGSFSTMAAPYEMVLPGNRGTLELLLPHEVISSMTARDPGQWCLDDASVASGKLGAVLDQWSKHPDVEFTGNLSDVFAIGLHADGVSYTSSVRPGSSKKVLVCSWNIISARRPELQQQRQPFFVLHEDRKCKCGCGGYCTYQEIWKVLAWSLGCMLSGRAPTCRHDTSPWLPEEIGLHMADGAALRPAALVQVRGDWEWLVGCFRLRYYTSQHFCWMCDATRDDGPMCFKDTDCFVNVSLQPTFETTRCSHGTCCRQRCRMQSHCDRELSRAKYVATHVQHLHANIGNALAVHDSTVGCSLAFWDCRERTSQGMRHTRPQASPTSST